MLGVKPNLPLSLTMLSWGFNFVALKLLYEQMTPPAVALVRYLGMFLLLVLICAVRRESLRYPRQDAMRLLTLGFLSMGVYMVFFLEGMRDSAPAEGAILLSTSPIFTALIASAVGQERLNRKAFVGALIAFGGVAIVVFGARGEAHGKLIGNLLILVSSVLWAASTVYSRPLVERISPFRVLTLSMPGALVVLLPYGLVPTWQAPWSSMSPTTWGMLGYVAVIAGAIAFVGFYEGVRQIGGPAAMVYQYFVPVLAALSAWIVLGSTVNALQFVGMGVVLGGVSLSNRARLQGRSTLPGGR